MCQLIQEGDFGLAENKKSKMPVSDKVNIAICCGLFLFMMFFVSFLNANFFDLHFGGASIGAPSVSGVITVLMIMICLKILTIDNHYGFAAAMLLMSSELTMVASAVFVKKNFQSVAGIAMMLGGIFLVINQHKYIATIEKNENYLRSLSVTDALTGLTNRRGIMNEINMKISCNEPFTLFYLDLDNFKNINDTMGHACGDIVLCEITRRWLSVIGEGCTLARTGGDEFALIVSDDSEESADAAANSCINSLKNKLVTEKCDYYASVSIGSASFPHDATDCDNLMRYADSAMYKAKSAGKNQLCRFDSRMLMEINSEMNIETEIRSALRNDTFKLVFQPQFTAEGKKLRGYETLLRMSDGNGNPVSPAVFIPIAEKSGLILDIDRWVLRHAMKTFSKRIITEDIILSVNISARHITELNFAEEVEQILKETGFPPEHLEIEVTESCFISSVEAAIAALKRIKESGVLIALDDFGTGYASLSYLSRLPIDLVKIDKSFVDQLETADSRGDFVKAIISIGHMFRCKVIAEGVELDSQLSTLRELSCDYIQGYIWGKPAPIEENAIQSKV